MKKKITSFVLAIFMAFSVIGCGHKAVPASTQEQTQNDIVEDASKEDDEETSPEAGIEAEAEESAGPYVVLNKICNSVEEGYEGFRGAGGGVIIVRDKTGSYGAIDYEKNEIVPCMYSDFTAPNNNGYFVMRDDVGENLNLYAPDGSLITSLITPICVSGNYYSTISYEPDERLQVYDLEGNLVTEASVFWEDIWLTGSRDGVTLLRNNKYDMDSNYQLIEIGKLDEKGKIEWQTEYDGPMLESRIDLVHPGGLFSGLNDGYYLISDIRHSGNENYKIWVYDSDNTLVSEYSFQYMSPEGVYTEGGFYYDFYDFDQYDFALSEPYPECYFYDGAYYYSRGTKTVWNLYGNYQLIDLVKKELLAEYDYISMNEGDRWLVSDGEKWGYIDTEGNLLATFDDASDFSNDYAFIREDGIAYLIDRDFNKLVEIGPADGIVRYGDLLATLSGKDGTTLYKPELVDTKPETENKAANDEAETEDEAIEGEATAEAGDEPIDYQAEADLADEKKSLAEGEYMILSFQAMVGHESEVRYAKQPVNIRTGPSTDYEIVGQLETDQEVEVIAYVCDNEEPMVAYWYVLKTDDGSRQMVNSLLMTPAAPGTFTPPGDLSADWATWPEEMDDEYGDHYSRNGFIYCDPKTYSEEGWDWFGHGQLLRCIAEEITDDEYRGYSMQYSEWYEDIEIKTYEDYVVWESDGDYTGLHWVG